MIDDLLMEAELKMVGAIDHTRNEFGRIRTGRANPGLVTDIPIEYYGSHTPLQQLAGVSVPEPRMLLITPYDQSALKNIERAIIGADLGLNPSNDGKVIRVVFPELTEERRKEFVRLARERAEEGRISIRNIRRAAKNDITKLLTNSEITEDDERRSEKQLQDVTNKHVAEIDAMLANKEKELLEV